MKHTDDTHCSWAHRPGACHRTHVPGMGKDHYMGTQRPATDPEGCVMQGHVDYCAEYGHAEGGGYGIAGLCARCGDPLPATPVADLQVGDLVVRTLDRHGAVGRVVSIDLDYSDPYAVVQFDDGNWSGARLAWTRVSNGTPPTFDADTRRCTGTFLGGRCPHDAPCPIHPTMPTYCDHLGRRAYVEPGAGCGTGSDGFPCCPARLAQ